MSHPRQINLLAHLQMHLLLILPSTQLACTGRVFKQPTFLSDIRSVFSSTRLTPSSSVRQCVPAACCICTLYVAFGGFHQRYAHACRLPWLQLKFVIPIPWHSVSLPWYCNRKTPVQNQFSCIYCFSKLAYRLLQAEDKLYRLFPKRPRITTQKRFFLLFHTSSTDVLHTNEILISQNCVILISRHQPNFCVRSATSKDLRRTLSR